MSSKKLVLEIIKMYREQPCLWKVSHPDYRDKAKRSAALQELVELFQTYDPEANRDTVVKKLTALRGCFKKELNKVKMSKSSGAEPYAVHVPKLWYYDYMLFLEAHEDDEFEYAPSPLEESFEEARESSAQGVQSFNNYRKRRRSPIRHSIDDSGDPLSPQSENCSTSQQSHTSMHSFKGESETATTGIENKYNMQDSMKTELLRVNHIGSDNSEIIVPNNVANNDIIVHNNVVNNDMSIPTNVTGYESLKRPKLVFDSFGEHVAEQLRVMPQNMQKICTKLINDAIFLGSISNLSNNAHIVN